MTIPGQARLANNSELAIVMPVYNEEDSIERVVREWMPIFQNIDSSFFWLVLNDGSTDSTAIKLEHLANEYKQIKIVEKTNTGHGQSCIEGYRMAIALGAEYVFQIDSDGQCDPQFFSSFWNERHKRHAIFGNRVQREDGFLRIVISRVLSLTVFLATGTWLKDSNVPYRLISSQLLSESIRNVPKDFYLANILVSLKIQRALMKQSQKIHWQRIFFRNRFAGNPSAKFLKIAKHGLNLYFQLKKTDT